MRLERVKKFVTGQNHRKVSPGLVKVHQNKIYAINVMKKARESRE